VLHMGEGDDVTALESYKNIVTGLRISTSMLENAYTVASIGSNVIELREDSADEDMPLPRLRAVLRVDDKQLVLLLPTKCPGSARVRKIAG
jgi:hypothetical protein